MIKIVEDGWEFVMECRGESDHEHYCDRCKAYGKCKQESKLIKICGILEEKNILYICTSAQKVTEEAKVYATHNKKYAKALVGDLVFYWENESWLKGTLSYVSDESDDQAPFEIKEHRDSEKSWYPAIKEIPTRHLTFTQIKALHPDLEDVVLVEEN